MITLKIASKRLAQVDYKEATHFTLLEGREKVREALQSDNSNARYALIIPTFGIVTLEEGDTCYVMSDKGKTIDTIYG